ncbi:ribonuclease J [Aerococcus mictus]|uniref:ribonuclease J n=1 Tax=Aerococcus mictus TaxID=2976810 RepID=UPI0018A7D9A3|nr:ribonuclease J [Aerococcus mictus]
MSGISIIPLGGVREDGKNMYLVEVNDKIFILDCGLIFPPDEMLGVDIMIPDFTYVIEHKDKVAGVFLSHGHADAIGALPYLLKEVNVPVFGTELTIELAKINCKKRGVKNFKDFYVIDDSNEIDFDDAVVKFFSTTHTVPESLGIAVQTEEGSIVYTGDFKFDLTVGDGYKTSFNRIGEIASSGVIALLSDSQHADSYFENTSEEKLEQAILKEVDKASGRVVLATVDSNILRIQQVLNVARATNRHVFLSGDQIEEIIDVAIRLNKLTIPSKNLIQPNDNLKNFADDEIIILETGEYGEILTNLQAMSKGSHKNIKIQKGDLVLITSSPSVGLETVMADTEDEIYRAGGHALQVLSAYKSSGHASPKDLEVLIGLFNPDYVVPVSGEYRLLHAHGIIAQSLGYDDDHIFLLEKGDVLKYEKGKLRLASSVPSENVLVDGSGVGDIGNIVLRDRRILSEDGIFVIVLTISRSQGKILSQPEIISRGFVFMKESTDLLNASKELVREEVEKALADPKNFDWADLKGKIREVVAKYLYKETNRRPMVLPVIMESSHRRGKRNFKKENQKNNSNQKNHSNQKNNAKKNNKPNSKNKHNKNHKQKQDAKS